MTSTNGYVAETYDPQGSAIQTVHFYSSGTTTTPQVATSMAFDTLGGNSGSYSAYGDPYFHYNPVGFGG
jgi:predicted Zn-dependent peptidase